LKLPQHTIRGCAQALEICYRSPGAAPLIERESHMYARKASLCLKTESASKFLEKIEHEVTPLLRKQKGFLDQLTTLSDGGEIIHICTFGKTPKMPKNMTAQRCRR
jgi:hypothetical protein